MRPEIGMAASARDWPDRLHRFLLDHGGARVTARVNGVEQALGSDYQVLLIDDICSFLTPRLVRRLRELGREVVGIFGPEDGHDAKRRLLECGISDVIEADAQPEEFLKAVGTTLTHHTPVATLTRIPSASAFRVAVCGAATGVGSSEVALALASHLAGDRATALLDLDQLQPGLAQRLDLPLYPNLRTAVDLSHHDVDRLLDAVQMISELAVVGGLAIPAGQDQLRPVELLGLIEDLAAHFSLLVLDVGATPVAHVVSCPVILVVGEGSPVGLARLVRAVEATRARGLDEVLVVVNRLAPRGRNRDETRVELSSALPGLPIVLLPEDQRVHRAAWDGTIDMKGPFARAVGQIAELIGARSDS